MKRNRAVSHRSSEPRLQELPFLKLRFTTPAALKPRASRHGTDVLVLVSVSNDLCLKASLARTTVALGTAAPAAALQTPAVPSAQSRPRPNSSFFTEELFLPMTFSARRKKENKTIFQM